MNLSPRYRRFVAWSVVSLILGLIYDYWPESSSPAVVAPTADTVALAERSLARMRDTAATVPAKEEILKKVNAELATREKGLIVADTAAQAQAQLLQIVRAIGAAESPAVDIRNVESFAIHPLGDAYGEASVSVQMECRIDQLINMLASVAARPELVSTGDLRVTSSNAKEKTIGVHLTVSGVVPRKLVPQKHT